MNGWSRVRLDSLHLSALLRCVGGIAAPGRPFGVGDILAVVAMEVHDAIIASWLLAVPLSVTVVWSVLGEAVCGRSSE
jgi:hypothetical protein